MDGWFLGGVFVGKYTRQPMDAMDWFDGWNGEIKWLYVTLSSVNFFQEKASGDYAKLEE